MLKGCQKRIVLVKDTGSSLFSEAYFVLSEEADRFRRGDIVEEATRIAARETGDMGQNPQNRWVWGFVYGFCCCLFLLGVGALIYFGGGS